MDIKLEQLIEKVKKEGVEAAQQQAEKILQQARLEADKIKKDATLLAQETIQEGRQQADKLKTGAQAALAQASRDLVLVVKEKIKDLFVSALKSKVGNTMTEEFIAKLIVKIIDQWRPQEQLRLQVEVSDKDKEGLRKLLAKNIKQEVKNSVEIKVNPAITKGFRLSVKGDDAYYDFSDESITEALALFLPASISEWITGAKGA